MDYPPLTTRQRLPLNPHRLSQRPPKRFKQTLNLVMVVIASRFQVQGRKHRKRNELEEMLGQFGAEIAHFVAFEFSVEFSVEFNPLPTR